MPADKDQDQDAASGPAAKKVHEEDAEAEAAAQTNLEAMHCGCFKPQPVSYAAERLVAQPETTATGARKTIYAYSFVSLIEKEIIRLSDFKGKVMLIVNVASHCNLTTHSYLQLNELLRRCPELVIIGCPCNQFGHQENLHDEEILTSLKYIRPGKGFVPHFRLTDKLEVNGANSHAVFNYLRLSLPSPSDKSLLDETATGGGVFAHPMRMLWMPVSRTDITWNFEKFLIGPDGIPFRRYSPRAEVLSLEEDVKKLIKIAKGEAESPSAAGEMEVTTSPSRKRTHDCDGCE